MSKKSIGNQYSKKSRISKKHHKNTKNILNHRNHRAKKSVDSIKVAIGAALFVFAAAGIIIVLLTNLLLNKPVSGKTENYSASYPEESPEVPLQKAPFKSNRYELSDEEIQKLKELGITDEQIASTNPDEFLADLYSREAYINQVYMIRQSSPNIDAKEPSEDMRAIILEDMKNCYASRDYSGVIKTFNEYLMAYNFESFQDAEITGLYHDAAAMVPAAPEDEEVTPKPVTKEDVINAMRDRYSAWAVAYDAFNLNVEMVKDQTVDRQSCIIVSPLKEIALIGVYDPRAGEIDLSGASAAADIIYEFSFTDINSKSGKIYVQSTGIKKQLVGVYYDGNGCTFIESW